MIEEENALQQILEAILFSAGKPQTEQQLLSLFEEESRPALADIRQALFDLQRIYDHRAVELKLLASGYQFQSRAQFAPWVGKLWEEKPSKYSRALLETLALIAYRQPITRGDIEDIRGVSISQSIFKTIQEERNWVRIVGHKEVPGRPGLYATTKQFLDYFGLKSLDELPSLPEIMSLADVETQQDVAVDAILAEETTVNKVRQEEITFIEERLAEEVEEEVEEE